ncbi:MAG: hypothetical protein JNK67_01790 [Alphaproteobacteria bacterium]|nr:hypothetical protein [Alphaproteobacteria bacterium]
MRMNPWTMVVAAILIIGAVAIGATMFEPKHDGPFEKLGEKVDKAIK